MQEGHLVLQSLARVYEATFGEMPSSALQSHGGVGLGVAVTAVAGVVVVAAVGGLIYYNEGKLPFELSFSSRRSHSPLNEQKWVAFFDHDQGRLLDGGDQVIYKVRGGGIDPNIRAQVWPFLLGVYELGSSLDERDAEKATKLEEYEELRAQCVNVVKSLNRESEGGDEAKDEGAEESVVDGGGGEQADDKKKGSSEGAGKSVGKRPREEEDFQTWQRIIRLDAVRMNAEWIPYAETQAHVTFEEAARLSKVAGLQDDEHLEPPRRHHAARLVLILEAYTIYDPKTGYCQGMSDLLSPFVALIDDDYEAFWCFVRFMKVARHNFRLDEVGIRRQLNLVSAIIKAADPLLFQHLTSLGCEDCTFIYRMVVVLMRRELSFEHTLCLWEVMWADWAAIGTMKGGPDGRKRDRLGPPSRDLLLYVIAAAVRNKRTKILQSSGMDELVRECNDMAGKLEIWKLLADARELVRLVQHKVTESVQ
ncbi:rab GTPase-activating protein 22 [Physcomitrium patens]|uniref:Rab-GAP TBC domain-containing protein n=1 Tax=Physcomitrium patens TaxID=3218 RepID=A0A2K1JHG1_PHYPA|nr:GTPase-activating protein gyp7-like [Physcomitrium patens]PNR40959.1 hypothetical protein PHYPA_018362 [Physcomitrium patens]|eukprot:XP_024394750.1 GTPase-activating protein gyp7-like [Physcomitrella patens]